MREHRGVSIRSATAFTTATTSQHHFGTSSVQLHRIDHGARTHHPESVSSELGLPPTPASPANAKQHFARHQRYEPGAAPSNQQWNFTIRSSCHRRSAPRDRRLRSASATHRIHRRTTKRAACGTRSRGGGTRCGPSIGDRATDQSDRRPLAGSSYETGNADQSYKLSAGKSGGERLEKKADATASLSGSTFFFRNDRNVECGAIVGVNVRLAAGSAQLPRPNARCLLADENFTSTAS